MIDETNRLPDDIEDDDLLDGDDYLDEQEDETEEAVHEVEADETDDSSSTVEEEAEPVEVTKRIFKVGSTKIEETESTIGKTPAQVRMMLKSMYPELANTTNASVTTSPEGVQVIEWKPQPGRKG